jgi:hypothetical protein
MHDMAIMMQCNLSKLSGIEFRHTYIWFKLFLLHDILNVD